MQWLNTIALKTAALNQLVGVHLAIDREGVQEVYFVRLQRKKQKLLLLEKGSCLWQEFLQRHPKGIPLVLSVDGKGVLTKTFRGSEDVMLEEVLPGANEEDFYYNSLNATGSVWVSLARKPVLDQLIAEVQAAGLSLAGLQLGPLSVASLLPLLQDDPILQLPHWQVQHQEGQLTKLVQHSVQEEAFYRLGDESLSAAYIQPYANALSALVALDAYSSSNLADVWEQWLHKRLYTRLGVGLLSFFFGLLLLNFAFFSYLSSQQQTLNSQLQQHQHLLGQLQILQKQEEARRQLLQAVPLQHRSLFAYHADLLGASIPAGVQLEELILHPAEGRKNKQEALRFQHGFIEVRGYCNNPQLLNSWLEKLEKEPWVKAVKNQRYGSASLGQSGSSFGFTLAVAAP